MHILTLIFSAINVDASSKPKVECSVVTEFTDHICVTMDAELIMFLHDLVSAYLKEKEKGKGLKLKDPLLNYIFMVKMGRVSSTPVR